MFKRKYVKISSEKVIEKIEGFLQQKGGYERLEPNELYAFRYALGGMKIDINSPCIIKRIGLNDIPTTFHSSKFIIFSENGKYGLKSNDCILDIFSKLNERIIFLNFSFDGKYIEQIHIYIPSTKDATFFVNDTEFFITDICNDCKEFFKYLSEHDTNLFKYHIQIQDEKIIPTFGLNYGKEFLSVTTLDIEGSTVIFHYVP